METHTRLAIRYLAGEMTDLVGLLAGDAGDDDDGVAGVAADGDARVGLLLGGRELALQGAD